MAKTFVYTDISHRPSYSYYGSAWVKTTEHSIIASSEKYKSLTKKKRNYGELEALAVLDFLASKENTATPANKIVILCDSYPAVQKMNELDENFLAKLDNHKGIAILRQQLQDNAIEVRWTRGISVGHKGGYKKDAATLGHKVAHELARAYNHDKDDEDKKKKTWQEIYNDNKANYHGLHQSAKALKKSNEQYRDELNGICPPPKQEEKTED